MAPSPGRQALAFLTSEILAEDAFAFPRSILDKAATERFRDFEGSVWEIPRNDFPIHEILGSIQSRPIDHVFSPLLMSRMLDVELRGGDALTLPEVFDAFREAIWAEVSSGRSIGSLRRNLQRAHLDKLVELVVSPLPGTPDDASALARANLKTLGEEIRGASSAGDAYTGAHLDESLAIIEAALEAGIERKVG